MTKPLTAGHHYMNHKEITAHLRNRIRAVGLRSVGVRMVTHTGAEGISVYPKGGVDARFSLEDQKTIAHIARVNGLAFSCGLPIEDDGTHGPGFVFYLGYGS